MAARGQRGWPGGGQSQIEGAGCEEVGTACENAYKEELWLWKKVGPARSWEGPEAKKGRFGGTEKTGAVKMPGARREAAGGDTADKGLMEGTGR